MKGKGLAITLSATCFVSSLFMGGTAAAAQQSESIEVYYAQMHFVMDDKHFAPSESQKGFIYKGSTYVPLRFIAYTLNKAVEWDAGTYTVTVKEPTASEEVTILEYQLNREIRKPIVEKVNGSLVAPTSAEVYFEQVRYVFDGITKQPSTELPGLILDNTLYVPMRFMSESMGKKIEWDPETYSVRASSKKALEEQAKAPAPAQAPQGGPAGGMGGGVPAAGAPAKPSRDALIKDAEGKIQALRSEAESVFNGLKNQYLAATDDEEKAAVLSKAWSELSRINSTFYGITGDLRNKLESNGYDSSIVSTYEAQYEKEKQEQQRRVLSGD